MDAMFSLISAAQRIAFWAFVLVMPFIVVVGYWSEAIDWLKDLAGRIF